jgi:hypothetical protein
MNSRILATISLVVAASLIAGTIAVSNPAFAQGRQNQGAAQAGLITANVQAQVQEVLNNNDVLNHNCVAAIFADAC